MSGTDRAATIYDVAKAAGVSHQTVSRYLRGFEGIRPSTQERVEQALVSLGYKPNLAARALRTSKSMLIGALAHEMAQLGPARTIQGASLGARQAGYLLDIVILDGFDDKSISDALDSLGDQNVAGIFAIAQTERVKAVLEHHAITAPMFIDSRLESTVDGHASPINDIAGQSVAEHLLALGHRHIAVVTGPPEWVVSRDRLAGFARVLAAAGLSPAIVAEGDWSPRSGYEAAMSLRLDDGITAIFAQNDHMALGVLRALGERGIRVPEDVSIVGFDDIPEAAFLTPALTTVRVDFEAEGRFAINWLIAEIEGRPVPDLQPPLPSLIVRDSTAPAR